MSCLPISQWNRRNNGSRDSRHCACPLMPNHTVHEEAQSMRSSISVILTIVFLSSSLAAQSARAPESATKPIQPSESAAAISAPAQPKPRELKLPAGTPIDIEATYTVSSIDFRPGDYLSFRVLIPVMIDGVTLIDKGSLVTGRVFEAKRGGHW